MLKRGFTLIELSVSVLVIALIFLVLIMVFRSNITAWKWGQTHMEFNQRVQLVMKQVFTDIKRINPIVVEDADGHIWFQGEKIGDLFPNLVNIIDKDGDMNNGGEELAFYYSHLENHGEKNMVRYFLEENKLIRQSVDYHGNKKDKIVAEMASDLSFKLSQGDIREIGVKFTMEDPKKSRLKEVLDFAVRLDTDLVCVKMVANGKN